MILFFNFVYFKIISFCENKWKEKNRKEKLLYVAYKNRPSAALLSLYYAIKIIEGIERFLIYINIYSPKQNRSGFISKQIFFYISWDLNFSIIFFFAEFQKKAYKESPDSQQNKYKWSRLFWNHSPFSITNINNQYENNRLHARGLLDYYFRNRENWFQEMNDPLYQLLSFLNVFYLYFIYINWK